MYILAENIRILRQRFGMTQEELAEKIGVSKGTVSNYENDITRPACSKLSKIADTFDISVRELFEGTVKGSSVNVKAEPSKAEGEVKSQNRELTLTGIPYLYIYDDENSDIVVCVAQTGRYMLLDDYDGDKTVITSCGNTYYVINLESEAGEQFICGSHNVGEIIQSVEYKYD